MNIFVFDIETIPDTAAGRKLYCPKSDLSDADVAQIMFARQREKSGSDFLPLHLHKIVAISAVLRTRDKINVWSLGDTSESEASIIQRFFEGIEKYSPILVSWNGGGFDLPVLHYRALIHSITAQQYWENGATNNAFKWNNYTNRYHERHTDLMDILAGFQARANAPLDQIATLCGFPGKMGMSGDKVWDTYQAGNLSAIRDYCETDVLNTYLVYLKFQLMRGHLTENNFAIETQMLKDYLETEYTAEPQKKHFKEFLENWNQHG